MTRKSSSTQRPRGGQSGSSQSRNRAGNQTRQSASSQRDSAQSDRGRTRSDRSKSTGRGGSQTNDNQEWNFAQPRREYDESRPNDERSFGSRDYEQGRQRPDYSSQSEGGRGFNPDRREFASRGGRAGPGRSEDPGQSERRFSREMDSYYGRSPRGQDARERSFQGHDDYRSPSGEDRGAWPQPSREDEYRSSQSRYQPARSNYDEHDRRPFPREDYSSADRQQGDRDDFRREEGYEDQARGYQGSSREGDRYSQEDNDRFYAGRGQRGDERESSGQRRSSGSHSGRSTGSSRRRD